MPTAPWSHNKTTNERAKCYKSHFKDCNYFSIFLLTIHAHTLKYTLIITPVSWKKKNRKSFHPKGNRRKYEIDFLYVRCFIMPHVLCRTLLVLRICVIFFSLCLRIRARRRRVYVKEEKKNQKKAHVGEKKFPWLRKIVYTCFGRWQKSEFDWNRTNMKCFEYYLQIDRSTFIRTYPVKGAECKWCISKLEISFAEILWLTLFKIASI